MAGRILVLDDEENYAEMLQDLLREHNYRVDMATRPERAIDQLEGIPYDLVISDYKMPVMDGSDFLRKARELYPNLPFILVSGLMNTPELVKVANMNVTLVMEKPVDIAAFLSQVAKFAEAMTDDEKNAAAGAVDANADAPAAQMMPNFPEEPRFFSAGSAISKRFMQHAWQQSQAGGHLFVLEPVGGDAVLAVKDLSFWRGNLDKPVQEFSFDDFTSASEAQIKELIAHDEVSDVVSVRLSTADQIAEASTYLEHLLETIDAAKSTFFVYLLESSISEAEFQAMAGPSACVVPSLCKRPTDVAHYARRFARLLAGRSAQPKPPEFSPEAAYMLLMFDWPGNYRQIKEVVSAAVQKSEASPITLEVLNDLFDGQVVPAPERRLAELLKKAQIYHLEGDLLAPLGSVAKTVSALKHDSSSQQKAILS